MVFITLAIRDAEEASAFEFSVMTFYAIEVTDLAVEELRVLRAFERRPILEAIRQQLTHEPTVITRNRKRLEPLVPVLRQFLPFGNCAWENIESSMM